MVKGNYIQARQLKDIRAEITFLAEKVGVGGQTATSEGHDIRNVGLCSGRPVKNEKKDFFLERGIT